MAKFVLIFSLLLMEERTVKGYLHTESPAQNIYGRETFGAV